MGAAPGPNNRSARVCPSRMATGVRSIRWVASPMAWIDGTLVVKFSSTFTAQCAALSSTPAGSSPRPMVLGRRPVATFFDRGRRAAKSMDNTSVGHCVAHAIAHVVVEAPQHIRTAHDERDLRAQALEQRSELDRDIAAADHEKAARKDGQIEDLVRADRILNSLDPGWRHRARAAGDKDMARGDLASVGKPHTVRVDDGRPLFD